MNSHVCRPLALLPLLLASMLSAATQETPAKVSPEGARANFARPVVLAPDDVRALPDAPAGFDQPKPGQPQGVIEDFTYESGVTGTRRHANVYLPPGYSAAKKYPVLFLLHGIAGNQFEWLGYIKAQPILDNLINAGKAVPMIVVFPNGRALPDDRPPTGSPFTPENAAGFAKFERDLFEFLLPAVESRYPVIADREHRALAGLSMGAGQTLNFGLGHMDTFAWLGAFSGAPITKAPADLVPDPAAVRQRMKLVYLSCGNRDGLISVSQGVHRYLKEHDVPHIWNVDDAGHDVHTWNHNLYSFAEKLFR